MSKNLKKTGMMDLIKNKLSLRLTFVIFWLTTIASFIFTMNFSNAGAGKAFPSFLTDLFLTNILLGIFFFFAMLPNFKKVNKFTSFAPLIALVYFIFYATILTSNGFGLIASIKTNDNIAKPTDTLAPTLNSSFPLDKLTLGNYSWENNYFSGEIKNNYDKNVTGVEIKILVSKSHKAWDVGDEFTVKIEDPILAGESVHFNKYLLQKENDPWYTTRIISGLYYYGDKPSPTPIPIPKPIYIAPTVDPDPPVLCNISPTCGGGTTPLRQSECSKSVCCQIGDKWIFYKDNGQCDLDQQNYIDSNNNYVPPAYVPPVYNAPTYNYQSPTSMPYVAPTIDPQVAIERISSCKFACIGPVDSYLLSFRNQCRANNGLGGSYCQNILNSRTTLITSCQNNCK